MKRFHVHVVVPKLDESVRFYSSMFGAQPTKKTITRSGCSRNRA
jgi:catechol 2,3-dioxygenase-like lactoylglutathione lyase family enzyme